MIKEYEKPEIQFLSLGDQDVIRTSTFGEVNEPSDNECFFDLEG